MGLWHVSLLFDFGWAILRLFDLTRDPDRPKLHPKNYLNLLARVSNNLFPLDSPQVIHSRRESDAGTYWCEAKNEFGVARSRNATLQVACK